MEKVGLLRVKLVLNLSLHHIKVIVYLYVSADPVLLHQQDINVMVRGNASTDYCSLPQQEIKALVWGKISMRHLISGITQYQE